MDKYLYETFPNPDYPVVVRIEQIKKTEKRKIEWITRPSEFEIIIVNTGGLQIFCDDGVHTATVGNGILFANGCRHRMVQSPDEDTTYYSLIFDASYTGDITTANDLGRRYFAPSLEMLKSTCMIMEEEELVDEKALDIINSIIVENTVKKNGYEIITKGHMCMLWGMLLEYLGDDFAGNRKDSALSQDELRVKAVVSFLKERYADIVSLSDVADRINVSRNECCRCFKRVLDDTPIDYLMRLRIYEAAKKLYKDPSSVHTISELAFDSGFNSTSYFNKIFKRYFECSPLEYAKMLKSDTDKARLLYNRLGETLELNF